MSLTDGPASSRIHLHDRVAQSKDLSEGHLMIRLILITIREARLILQRFNASHQSEFKYFWATHAAMGELRAPAEEESARGKRA